ncbi:TolC family protein [bacterium]|nr:TolC family protein [bacterium]
MRAGLLVCLVLLLALAGAAEPRRLTISEALSLCYERNPELAAARADTRQTRSAYHLAGVLPTGSFVAGATRGWGPAALSSFSALPRDEYLQFQQPFFPFGAMKKGQYVAWLNWKEAQAKLLFTKIQLMRQTKDAFYEVLASQQRLVILRANLDLARQIFESSEKETRQQRNRRLELLASRVQFNQVQQALVQAEGDLQSDRADLARVLGMDRGSDLLAVGSLDTEYIHPKLEELLLLGQSSPALMAVRQATASGYEQVKLASLQGNPTPSLIALYDFRLPSYIVGAQLTVPLDWGQIGYDVQSKERAAAALDERYRAAQLELNAEIQKAYAAFIAGGINSANYEEDVLQPQEEAVKLIQADYKAHKLDYDVVLLAQQQLEDIRVEYLSQQLIERLALNGLEEAVGAALEIITPAPREPDLSPEPDLEIPEAQTQ